MRTSKLLMLMVAFTLAGACGSSGGSKGQADERADKGAKTGIAPGDKVDTDGDGASDGVAIDVDGDGDADGIDTDGDGKIDSPLPADSDGGTSSGGVYVPPDGSVPYPVNEDGQVLCGSEPCKCADGIENDDDGLIDAADPECVAPWDNDEASLATGIAGDNRDDACQDCFFDGNSGHGNDGCHVASSCITDGNPSSGNGICATCEASNRCQNFCKAFTPNGCDCFGCCEVRLSDGSKVNVTLSPSCSIDGKKLDGCDMCEPNKSCVNTCGDCELCPGKTVEDLPAKCFTEGGGSGGDGSGGSDTPPAYSCDDGEQVCGKGMPACPADYLCQYGCCVLSPITVL